MQAKGEDRQEIFKRWEEKMQYKKIAGLDESMKKEIKTTRPVIENEDIDRPSKAYSEHERPRQAHPDELIRLSINENKANMGESQKKPESSADQGTKRKHAHDTDAKN